MPNPLQLSDAVDLTNVAIQDVWIKDSEKFPEFYKQYFNVETGIVDYEVKDSSVSGLGYAGRIVENAAVTAASPVNFCAGVKPALINGENLKTAFQRFMATLSKRKRLQRLIERASLNEDVIVRTA